MEIDNNLIVQLIEDTATNAANIDAINKEMAAMKLDIKEDMKDMQVDIHNMIEKSYQSNTGISNLKTKITVYSGVVSLIFTIFVTSVVGKI